MRVAFFGTPEPAARLLDALLRGGYEVAPVVTAEDKPKGRGLQLEQSPVKRLAQKNGLTVFTPKSLKEPSFVEAFDRFRADVAVVCAYGRLIPKPMLAAVPKGFVNVHYSLLPKYRGASCVPYAILFGEKTSGVSMILLDEGLDTGPILEQYTLEVEPQDTAGTLMEKLTRLAEARLTPALQNYLEGKTSPKPQEGAASYCPLLKKEDAALDFRLEPEVLVNFTRAMHPWPKAYCFWKNERIVVHRARAETMNDPSLLSAPTGTAVKTGEMLGIVAKGGLFVPELLQREGRKVVDNAAFLRGFPEILGAPFTGTTP